MAQTFKRISDNTLLAWEGGTNIQDETYRGVMALRKAHPNVHHHAEISDNGKVVKFVSVLPPRPEYRHPPELWDDVKDNSIPF